MVKAAFKVNGEIFGVEISNEGTAFEQGQKATAQIMELFPNDRIILMGFMINGEYKPVDLSRS